MTGNINRFEAHESVNGMSGNVYKGFNTRGEGQTSYDAWLVFLERRIRQHSETTTTASYTPVFESQAPAPAPNTMSTVVLHPSEEESDLSRSSSPTLSDDISLLNLEALPRYYLVLRGERPGVYPTLYASYLTTSIEVLIKSKIAGWPQALRWVMLQMVSFNKYWQMN